MIRTSPPRRRAAMRRRWIGGLLLCATGAAAAGCASASPVGLPTAAHVPGTCATLATADEMVTASDVSPAVSCSGPHVYETYTITTVPTAITALQELPQPELLAAQGSICPLGPVRPYLGASELDSQWGISIWQKFPTRAEWKAHVRTVVCDIVVDSERRFRVPRVGFPLHDVMTYVDSARVRLCRTRASLTNITCDQRHAQEQMGEMTLGPDAAKDINAAGHRACVARMVEYTGKKSSPGFTVLSEFPNQSTASCWLASDHDVTGTQRAGLVPR